MTHDDGPGRPWRRRWTSGRRCCAVSRAGARVVGALAPLLARPLAGVVIIARGSSDHAAIYGRYLLEFAARRPVSLAAPSLPPATGPRPTTRATLRSRSASRATRPRSSTCWSPSGRGSGRRRRHQRSRLAAGGRRRRCDPSRGGRRASGPGHQDLHRPARRLRPARGGARAGSLVRRRVAGAGRPDGGAARDRAAVDPAVDRCARATAPSTSAAGSSSAPRSRARSR